MKTKEIMGEGILDTLKSKYQDAITSFTDPQYVAAKKAKASMITSLERAINQQINAGMIDLSLPPTTSTRQARSTPTATPETYYSRLNSIFENIVEAAPSTTKESLYKFLTRYTAVILPDMSKQEFRDIRDTLILIQQNWNDVPKRKIAMEEWADKIMALNQRRTLSRKNSMSSRKSSSTQAGTSTIATQNPQQQYTDTLNKQIERMTTDYKDDIPQIINTLITRLQQIDPSGYKVLIDKIKTLPAGGSTSSPSQSVGHSPTAESIQPKKNKKVSRKY